MKIISNGISDVYFYGDSIVIERLNSYTVWMLEGDEKLLSSYSDEKLLRMKAADLRREGWTKTRC